MARMRMANKPNNERLILRPVIMRLLIPVFTY
jgi:hypothetical protein